IPFILYHVPYAILILALLKRTDRLAFTYALALPAIALLQYFFIVGLIGFVFTHHPAGIVLYIVPWIMNIVVLVLAYKAIQVVGLHPAPSSLIVAAVVTFVYFSFIHAITPFMYRLGRLS